MIEFTKLDFTNTSLTINTRVETEIAYWANTKIKELLVVESEGIDLNNLDLENIDSKYIVFDAPFASEFETQELNITITNVDPYGSGYRLKKPFTEFANKGLVVIVICDYHVASVEPPCGADTDPLFDMTFIYNKCPIINEIVKTSKEVERPCEIPKSFVDTLLRYAALNYAILAKDWERVIKFWNKFYTKIGKHITTKCGCHG